MRSMSTAMGFWIEWNGRLRSELLCNDCSKREKEGERGQGRDRENNRAASARETQRVRFEFFSEGGREVVGAHGFQDCVGACSLQGGSELRLWLALGIMGCDFYED